MICNAKEDLITLDRVPGLVPKVNGKPPARSTVYAWANAGLRGVKLETIRVGRKVTTTPEAITRFLEATQCG